MEVSPKTLREIRFREKMRGYHPEDVDTFLEQVAVGLEALQDRLRQAVERAQRAEAVASDTDGADQTLRKTLVLAQRTADMAVQEAREQASRILASAEQQAQTILAEAEERGRRTLEETIAECKAELGRLESQRHQAQQDVETLQRWLDEHKEHLRNTLTEALGAVERAGVLWPAPSTRAADPPAARRPPTGGSPFEPSNGRSGDSGPDTAFWTPETKAEPPAEPVSARDPVPSRERPEPTVVSPVSSELARRQDPDQQARRQDPDQQAMDDFFDDEGGSEYEDEPRFGGRLRRRR